MVDKVFIKGLKVKGIIGVFEEERHKPQDIIVDVEIEMDLSRAGISDRIEDSISYKSVADSIRTLAANTQRFTVEALAQDIAQICLEYPQAITVRVAVTKPAAMKDTITAGVRIERHRV